MAQPLFFEVPPESPAMAEFLTEVRLRFYKKGELIFNQSEMPRNVYLVRDGEVHVFRKEARGTRTKIVGIEGRGSLFGEVSLLSREAHSSSAKAALDSSVYVIPGKAFLKLVGLESSVGGTVARMLSGRLRDRVMSRATTVPARVITQIYPEHPRRSSELSTLLAERLVRENPGPVLLCSFNMRGVFRKETGPNLTGIMERWPGINIHEIREMIGQEGRSFDLLKGDMLYQKEARYEKMAAAIPALLGRLRKYYSIILVDAGNNFMHPVISRILSQSDEVMLFRSVSSVRESGRTNDLELWNKAVSHCMNRVSDFFDKVTTISDETDESPEPNSLQFLNKIINRNSALYRNHVRLEGGDYLDGLPDRLMQRGINRIARRISGNSRGLCLGGGGARAFAHLGVLQVLEEEGIDFDAVAGVSMGAIVGAAYVQGIPVNEMVYLLKQILPNSRAILDKNIPFISFFRGRKMSDALIEGFGQLRFEDLEMPFFCNGSDLNSGKSIIFEKGYLSTALRASASLPGVFPPVKIGHYRIVDGGVMNNLPGQILRDKGIDRIIGINVSPLDDTFTEQSLNPGKQNIIQRFTRYLDVPPILKIVSRSIEIQGRELIKFRIKDFDYVAHPNVDGYDVFDFHKIDEIMERGRIDGEASLESIKAALTRQRMERRRGS